MQANRELYRFFLPYHLALLSLARTEIAVIHFSDGEDIATAAL
jgi:hypothetical protein